MTTTSATFELGRHSCPGADEVAAFFKAFKTLCPTAMEMCSELARGEIQGSNPATQKSCSRQLGDGVGDRPDSTSNGKGFRSLMKHPRLFLTQQISTTLLANLAYRIFKERRALRAEKHGGWKLIKSTKEQVESHKMVTFQNEKLIESESGEVGPGCRRGSKGLMSSGTREAL